MSDLIIRQAAENPRELQVEGTTARATLDEAKLQRLRNLTA